MAPVLVSLLTSLWGCTPPPVYNQITKIIIHTQTAGGTNKKELTGDALDRAAKCMYQTEEIGQAASNPDLLQAVILLQVEDRNGDRMFEFYTNENFKGNKGKYYRNNCIYGIIRGS
jgi:hypothetical protein